MLLCFFCSSRGTFWPPTLESPASTLTGRAWLTRWRTVRMLTRLQTSAVCFLLLVWPERCRPMDRCQTTPWTACKGPQIPIMDTELFEQPHTSTDYISTENMDIKGDIVTQQHGRYWGGPEIVSNFGSVLLRSLRSTARNALNNHNFIFTWCCRFESSNRLASSSCVIHVCTDFNTPILFTLFIRAPFKTVESVTRV